MLDQGALSAETNRSLALSQSRQELINGIFGQIQSYLIRQERFKAANPDADAGRTTRGPNVTKFNDGWFHGQCTFLSETIKTLGKTTGNSSTINHPGTALANDVKQDTTASNKPSTTQGTVDKHREHKSTATADKAELSPLVKTVNTGINLALQGLGVTAFGASTAILVMHAAKKYSRWR